MTIQDRHLERLQPVCHREVVACGDPLAVLKTAIMY